MWTSTFRSWWCRKVHQSPTILQAQPITSKSRWNSPLHKFISNPEIASSSLRHPQFSVSRLEDLLVYRGNIHELRDHPVMHSESSSSVWHFQEIMNRSLHPPSAIPKTTSWRDPRQATFSGPINTPLIFGVRRRIETAADRLGDVGSWWNFHVDEAKRFTYHQL